MSTENYKVYWIGTREGYGIKLTDDIENEHDVFRLYSEAKNRAVGNALNDIDGARVGLQNTKAIRKGDV